MAAARFATAVGFMAAAATAIITAEQAAQSVEQEAAPADTAVGRFAAAARFAAAIRFATARCFDMTAAGLAAAGRFAAVVAMEHTAQTAEQTAAPRRAPGGTATAAGLATAGRLTAAIRFATAAGFATTAAIITTTTAQQAKERIRATGTTEHQGDA